MEIQSDGQQWRVLIYLAHALLEVRGEAARDDGAAAVHALDDVGGDGGVRLAEHVDPALAPGPGPGPGLLCGPAAAGVVVFGPSGRARGPDAELLLLGVDAAVQAEARDAVALRRDVRHRAVEELLEASERQLPAREVARSGRGSGEIRSEIERGREGRVPGIEGSGERRWRTTLLLPAFGHSGCLWSV